MSSKPSFMRLTFLPVLVALSACTEIRASLVTAASDFEPKTAGEAPDALTPEFDGADAQRQRLPATLRLVASGLKGPTDIQPVPGEPGFLLVLGKNGEAHLVEIATGAKKKLFTHAVATESEQGLLGLAFHPRFTENRRFFLNYTPADGARRNRVAEWRWPKGETPREVKVLLDVLDPYPNHNGGQLAFGPDGHLYVGEGDGGWMNDPGGTGQDLSELLGSMLRLDVDRGATKSRPYGIPRDNPFVGKKGMRAEIWAYGLRNPWRYSFTRAGRLVVGDVGQSAEEEITYLEKGDNAGWDRVEGTACHEPAEGCDRKGLRRPIVTYGRDDGFSITGGYEVLAASPPKLKGLYVFGDYAMGRIWAMRLPEGDGTVERRALLSLGRFRAAISTFGRDGEGRVYVGAFDLGAIYRLE